MLTSLPFHISAQDLNSEIQAQLFPGTSPTTTVYHFSEQYQEKTIFLSDKTQLHGLLFPSKKSKGLIFYLHGSNDDLSTWGKISNIYTAHDYDLFMIDYRGYGKSEGKFLSEQVWNQDMQEVYNELKLHYSEDKIIILGQSLGSVAASYLGANNRPKMVILQAAFYNMADWLLSIDPDADTSQLTFILSNDQTLPKIKSPVYLFHGDKDQAVNVNSAYKLQELFKKTDHLYILKNETHNDFSKNQEYLKYLDVLLK